MIHYNCGMMYIVLPLSWVLVPIIDKSGSFGHQVNSDSDHV